ncbi:MAG: hypothetical protein MUP47_04155 [Phycisphaerae bacterium]|nr:hypothetical protein [Phycisphaerae bacterium]
MRTSTKAAVWVIAAVLAATADVGRAEMAMGESVDFPHAGLVLAFPAGYQSQTVQQPFDIARAILTDKDLPVQAVSVAAFPLEDPNISAEELADQMAAAQQQNLAVRNLQVLSKAPMKVADLPGAARLISYTFRGDETVAASVVFCRDLVGRQGRLEYVITVEAAADRKAEVLPALGEVVKSVRLMTVVRPIDIPLKMSSRVLEAPDGLIALRVPHGWFAETSEAGISLAQTDYALGGEPTVIACVLGAETAEVATPQQHAQQCIQAATQAAADQGMEAKVISQEPARLGSAEACQLVIEQRLPQASSVPAGAVTSQPASAGFDAELSRSEAPEPTASTTPATSAAGRPGEVGLAEPNNVVIVQRSVMLAPAQADKPPRCLALVLVCINARPASAAALMDKLAEGVAIRGTVQAATKPAAGEEPATSAPSAGTAETKPLAPG